MAYYIGGDLGTSALKLTVIDEKGDIVKTIEKPYPSSFPFPSASEQDPKDWEKALKEGLKEISSSFPKEELRSLTLDGQMHGLVALDENDQVIRPAILWNDGRSSEECKYLNETIGKEKLIQETGNIAYPGFTLPKILWMKKHEPELYQKIHTVLLPKDYLNFYLTGKKLSDLSDAAGTLVLDDKHQCWSEKMIELSGLNSSCFPELTVTGDYLGNILPDIAEECHLPITLKILQGSADNAAAAIGNGTLEDGDCNISLGTSGTIFYVTHPYAFDPNGAIHSFCYNKENYCLLACMLSAASSLKWLQDNVFESQDYNSLQKKIKEEDLGKKDLLFLPYLMGERSPINDPKAKGVFCGLSLDTKQEDLVQAVMEGVALALKDSFVRMNEIGLSVSKSTLTGGGSKSKLWRKILASVLNLPLTTLSSSAGPSYGMALIGLKEDGKMDSLSRIKERVIQAKEVTLPDQELVVRYEKKYQQFKSLYADLKPFFASL